MIGRVGIGEDVRVRVGATIRGDREPIRGGARSNVRGDAVLHADMGFPLTTKA